MVSCGSPDVAAWWMGALRAAYPLDHYSDKGDNLKMHPAMGVTLKLNRNDGTLKIKGKKHLQWFKDNFEQVLILMFSENTWLLIPDASGSYNH